MNEMTERPELGTTEAAVRSCVNLIALATHTDEEHLAYWLDCYYQLRRAHDRAEFFAQQAMPTSPFPAEETVEAPQPAAPAAPLASSRGAMSEGDGPEPPAAQKKKQSPADGG